MSFNHENYCRKLLERMNRVIDEPGEPDFDRTYQLAALADEFTDSVDSWHMDVKRGESATPTTERTQDLSGASS